MRKKEPELPPPLPILSYQEKLAQKKLKKEYHKFGYRSDRFWELIQYQKQKEEELEAKKMLLRN